MTTHKCNDCGQHLPTECFFKKLDGFTKQCKSCYKLAAEEKRKTQSGVIDMIYKNQLSSSKKRKHSPPAYTKTELGNWLIAQPNFKPLYDAWVASGYDHHTKPSVDRIDDYAGYSLNNIQLMTWGENKKKAHRDKRNGVNTKCSVAVQQFDSDLNLIAEYVSAVEAMRVTGVDRTSISKCCANRDWYKSAGGFFWKFKENQ